jgi:hypothetical protein
MSEYTIKPLDADTWDAFAQLAELHNGTRSLFEQAGFSYERPKGKNHCVMTKIVPRS